MTRDLQCFEVAVNKCFIGVPECDQLSVPVKDGIRIVCLGRRVYGRVIAVDVDPGSAGRKARIGTAVPLHRRACVVPRRWLYYLPPQWLGNVQALGKVVYVVGLHVPDLVYAGE